MKKLRIISIMLVIISILTISITYGLYTSNTNKLTNTFIKVKDTNIQVNETFNGVSKKDVSFNVESDVPTYLKVRLVFNFLDDQGNITSFKPLEGIDYEIDINNIWKYSNGYYYLDYPITITNTPILINNLTVINNEYKLALEILVQTTSDIVIE